MGGREGAVLRRTLEREGRRLREDALRAALRRWAWSVDDSGVALHGPLCGAKQEARLRAGVKSLAMPLQLDNQDTHELLMTRNESRNGRWRPSMQKHD